jgi:TnsA endonuclease N terminal/TnsA endonuclease C terminal
MTCRTPDLRLKTLVRRLAERIDDGSGKPHRPWVETSDISSRGFQTRMYCVKVSRPLHLHSHGEHAAALEGWWREDVVDIEEQKGLPTAKTCRAAACLGIHHPVYRKLRRPAVLSTDIFLVCSKDGMFTYEAQAVKNVHASLTGRCERLLAIEQEAWRQDGVPWTLVLADGMNARRSKNLAWLQQCENDMHARRPSDAEISAREHLLTRIRKRVDRFVIDACRAVEREGGFESGTAARAFRQIVTLRRIMVDLDARELMFEPVESIEIKPDEMMD